jgi:DNA-binding IclR family transcriptional regulator
LSVARSDDTTDESADESSRRPSGHVRAVQRAVLIVSALAEHPYPMGIVELSAFVQLSPASVHRLLATLIHLGWVEQNSRTSKYRLGMHVVGIGSIGLVTNPLLHDGRTYLSRLADWSGHDALLSTLVGVKTVQLARVAGANTELLEFEAGHPQPAHAGADGKLLLAYRPAEVTRYLYEVAGLPKYTPKTIVDPRRMEREFATIRSRGYAIDNGERFADGRGIAVPVMDPDGMPIAAMLCLGRISPDRDKEIVQQMQALARELSERLIATGDLPSSHQAPPPEDVPATPARTRKAPASG